MNTAIFNGYKHSQDAYDYAVKVSKHEIVVCIDAINACKRFLNDLEREGFRWVFDPEIADRAIKFIETLPHTKGSYARDKKLLKLSSWQKFFVANIFGWVDPETGFRRFREAYLEVPRKNGKSALASAISKALKSIWIVDEYDYNNVMMNKIFNDIGYINTTLLIVTTAGTDTSSPCYDKHKEIQGILSGIVAGDEVDRIFGIIYSIDESDDWMDASILAKANPNFNVSVNAEYLKTQQSAAIRNANNQNKFLIKHLNKWPV